MSGPQRRGKSGIFYFRKETPEDLKRQKDRLIGLGVDYHSSIHRSLNTRDPKEAVKAYSAVLLEVDAMWQGWRDLLASEGKPLGHVEKAALIREALTGFIESNEEDPGSVPSLPKAGEPKAELSIRSDRAGSADTKQLQDLKRAVTQMRRATPDEGSAATLRMLGAVEVNKLLKAWAGDIMPEVASALGRMLGPDFEAATGATGGVLSGHQKMELALDAIGMRVEAGKALEAAASFDYRQLNDLKDRLQAMPKATKKAKEKDGRVPITALYDLWKRDHEAAGGAKATAVAHKAKVAAFIKWLKHDDARAVTRGNLYAFADYLRHEKGISAKTIQGGYLSCIKAIFRKGFDRELLKENVAETVRYAVPKNIVTRSKGFSDEEAKAILSLANRSLRPPADGKPERRSMANRVAGRWVPWLQCYTGARVAEITQLRKEDVYKEHGVYCLRITPEAGSVKTGEYRLVPIHPHLVDMGFLKFVEDHKAGPLFYDPNEKRKEGKNTPAQWAGNALARWIKGELGDKWPKVQPNHAWRHRFKTMGREAEIDLHYLNVLQGHKDGTAAGDYGETTVKALYREICKLPEVTV